MKRGHSRSRLQAMLPRLTAILACGFLAHAQQQPAQFRADLQFVLNELPRLHAGFFASLAEADFRSEGQKLSAELDGMTPAKFYTRLQELISLARDAHTTLNLNVNNNGFGQLAIEFRWFADGVFVVAASGTYQNLLGAQVLKVGNLPVDEALRRLVRTVSTENVHWPRFMAPRLLRNPGVLRAIGAVDDESPVSYEFRLAGSEETQVVPVTELLGAALTPAITAAGGYLPAWLSNPEIYYLSQYAAASKLLYIRYSACNEQTGNPYAAFAQRTLEMAAANPVDSIVYDVRGNTGGNSSISLPLLFGLSQMISNLRRNPNFQLFVLSDQGTFSSGRTEVTRLRLPEITPDLGLPPGFGAPAAVHIGEPTGGKPGSFGEVLPFTLPASRIQGQYSTVFFDREPWIPEADSVYPDVLFPLASADYFARHDPHLAAALARARPAVAPGGEAKVVNAASLRPEQGVAPGSLAIVQGDYPDQAALKIGDAAVEIVERVPGRGLTFVVPEGLAPGRVAVEVRFGDAVKQGEFSVTPQGPGLFGATMDNAADAGSVIVLSGTGFDSGSAVWIANQPAELVSISPVTRRPGVQSVEIRIPAALAGARIVPVFAASHGFLSNGIAIRVR